MTAVFNTSCRLAYDIEAGVACGMQLYKMYCWATESQHLRQRDNQLQTDMCCNCVAQTAPAHCITHACARMQCGASESTAL